MRNHKYQKPKNFRRKFLNPYRQHKQLATLYSMRINSDAAYIMQLQQTIQAWEQQWSQQTAEQK